MDIECPEGVKCSGKPPKLNAFATKTPEEMDQRRGLLQHRRSKGSSQRTENERDDISDDKEESYGEEDDYDPEDYDSETDGDDHDRRRLKDLLNTPIDWRDKDGKNYLTKVDDQGWCGSCVTFGTLHGMEAAIALRDKTDPIKLSRDQLMDCSHIKNRAFTSAYFGFQDDVTTNFGCNGAFIEDTHMFLERHGVPTAEAFPYVPREDDKCGANTNPLDCSCKHVDANNEKLKSYTKVS
jgi:C1A family cysteine protease